MFTRFPVAKAYSGCSAAQVLDFVQWLIADFGIPEAIQSDNGPGFIAKSVKTFCTELDIRHDLTTPYHPQANGIVKRLNGTLIQALRRT